MTVSIKNTLLLFALVFTTLCFQSCKEEGCTDPNAINFNSDADENDGSCLFEGCTDQDAENYDSNADQDDGSCTYARTKFIGIYGAGESCDGGAATSLVVSIAESSAGQNHVIVTNETAGINVAGTVSGNTLTMNDTFQDGGIDITVQGEGTYFVDTDDQEKIDIEYTISNSFGTQSCIGLWIKTE